MYNYYAVDSNLFGIDSDDWILIKRVEGIWLTPAIMLLLDPQVGLKRRT